MNRSLSTMLLALTVALTGMGTSASAAELAFYVMEQPLGTAGNKTFDVQPASFLEEGDLPPEAGDVRAQPPRELALSETTGGYYEPCDSASSSTKTYCGNGGPQTHGVYYAEVDLLFLRTHLAEQSIGKLSEKYEFSPRFIIGYEDAGGVGARVRYWSYGRTTRNLDSAVDAVRADWDVLDIETTGRFGTERSELLIAGGLRWADLKLVVDEEPVTAELPGITFAADFRSILCRDCRSEWATVAGARWSLLGGDWEGSDFALISPTRDDNVTVTEIYGGIEYVQHYGGYDLFGRLTFEIQNWHSDAAAQTAGTDSIGFLGPGLHVGMNF